MSIAERFKLRLARHFTIVQSALALLSPCLIGLYISIFGNALRTIPSAGFPEIFNLLGYWNALLVVGSGSIVLQTYLSTIPRTTLKRIGDNLMKNGLEAACISLTYRQKDMNIRAIVTLVDKSGSTRTTRYSHNVRPDPERTATFPVNFGITGKAFTKRMVVAQDVRPDHMSRYPPEIQPMILPELRCVLAAPIYTTEQREAVPIGVLAFDSTEPLSETKFDTRTAKDVAQAWADLIGDILGWMHVSRA